tara:strand:+ start:6300 stop:8909 length:2610 start_codon:yes stop_codon:yes gene_type:complete
MTLEMLADNRIEFVRKFITEDKGQFPISIQNHVDDKQKESLSLQEAEDLVRPFRASITNEEVMQVVKEDGVFPAKLDMSAEEATQKLKERYPNIGRLKNLKSYITFILTSLSDDVIEEIPELTTELDDVLRNFTAEGQRLTSKMFLTNEIPSLINLQIVGDASQAKLKTYKRALETERNSKLRNRVKPIINYLTGLIQRDMPFYEADKLDADMLIGKLDLKFLTRREGIYDYWQGIHENKFDELVKAVSDFSDGLEDFDTEDERLKGIVAKVGEYADEFKQYPHSMQYTFVMKPLKMQDHMDKRDKYLIFFERFMSLTQGLGSGQYTNRKIRDELREELGELGPAIVGEEGRVVPSDDDDYGIEEVEEDLDDANPYESSATDTRPTDEARESAQERTLLGRKLRRIMQDVDVDPLFYYVYAPQQQKENKYSAWLDGPLFLKELRKLSRNFAIAGAKYTTDISSELSSYIDKLMQQASSTRSEYHLPVSPKLIAMIDDRELYSELDDDARKLLQDYNSTMENITGFLKAVGEIIDSSENEMERLSSPFTAQERSLDATVGTTGFGTSRKKTFTSELGDLKDDFDKMLDAIFEYYVKPINSRYKPFDDAIAFGDSGELGSAIDLFKTLTQDNKGANAFFMLLWAESIGQGGLIIPSQLDKMSRALKELSNPSKFKDMNKLDNALLDLKKAAMEIMAVGGNTFKDAIDIEIGYWYHNFLQRNNKSDRTFGGKSVSELAEDWSKEEIYPIEAIESYLERSGSVYEKAGMEKEVAEFRSALDDMKIVKSDEIPVLEVHDTIRKMMDKPIYYNTSKLDNFNHISTAMDIMEKEYNVEVSAGEIENIVTDMDSMENLSKRYGVPKESVYFLKATFR